MDNYLYTLAPVIFRIHSIPSDETRRGIVLMLTQVQRPNTSIQHMTDLEAKYLVTVVATVLIIFLVGIAHTRTELGVPPLMPYRF